MANLRRVTQAGDTRDTQAGGVRVLQASAPEATAAGGVFRRAAAGRAFLRAFAARVFARAGASRAFSWARSAVPILQTTLPFDTNEVVAFLFDFSRCPEFRAGETIESAAIPAVSGLTIGTPAATVAEADGIPAGGAVRATVSGGTAGTTYDLECRATFSGGAVRVVKGRLVAE